MLESGNLAENLENKGKNLDKNKIVDEKAIIFRLKSLDKLYKSKIDKKLTLISKEGTSKQVEDFRKEALLVYKEYQETLARIEKEILSIGNNEFELYLQAIEELKTELDSFENETENISLVPGNKENLQGIERLKYVEKIIYNGLGIDKETYNNGWGGQFCKGIIDEVILGNAELINLIYEEGIGVVIDMLDQLFSREGLQEIVKQLGISITDLFTGNAYEKGRSFGQLGLITTGGGLAFSGGKKLISIGKNLARKGVKGGLTELGVGLSVGTSELVNSMKNLPEYAKGMLKGILKHIGKTDVILIAGKTIEGSDLIMINKFLKAFELNHKLLGNEQYAYMSSSATYMLLKDFNILPGDLDVAVNPKNINGFIDNISKEIKSNPRIEEATFIELLGNGKTEIIAINDIDRIKKVGKEGRLNISYRIEGLEVELFPEVDGKGLTNLGYMDKKIVSHKIERGGKVVLEVPSLDNKGVAQGYVMNYLDEFGNSSIDGIEGKLNNGSNLGKIKMKDANRVNNIYILLKDAGLIENPEQLLRFIDDTVKEYEKLPLKGPYVKSAIESKNVVEGVEKLKEMIIHFYKELNKKLESGSLENIGKLPDFKKFSDSLNKDKIEAYRLYQEYLENQDKVSKKKLIELLDSMQKNIKNVHDNISQIKDFPYYYEYSNTKKFIEDLEKKL